MAKIVLASTNSGYNLSVINAGLQALANELNTKVLYRNNPLGEPNSMSQLLDMNGQAIINAGNVSVSGLSINGVTVEPGEAIAAATRQVFEFTATEGQTTKDVSPLEPTVSGIDMQVNGLSVRPQSLSVSTSTITFPPLNAGDEVSIVVYIRDVNAATTSDGIVFTSGKTGASASTVFAALENQWVNVKTLFGAVGDGVADDTAAIQAAIDSATGTVTGYVIYLPAGIYKISSPLNFGDKPNMLLRGDGPNISVISPTTLVTKAVIFGAGAGTSYQGITDISISCSNATSCIGVEVAYCDGFWFDKLAINNASVGLSIIGGVIQYFTNFRIERSKIAAIKLDGGNDHFFKHGVCSNVGGAEPSVAGMWVTASDAFWVDSVDFIGQKHGILLSPQGTDYISWVFISNSAFDSATGDGIRVEPAASALVKGVNFEGSWCASNEGYGVNLTGLGTIDGFRLNGHRSYRNKKSGYYIDGIGGTAINTAFVSCEASGNSWTNSGLYSGFDIAANVNRFSIIGCRSGQMAGQDNSQLRGILVNPGTSDNYIIALNDLTLNTGVGLLDGGTGLVKQVSLNIGA